MRILLFGRNGQVGFELQRTLGLLGELIALDNRRLSAEITGDLSDHDGIARTILHLRPSVIVNAAAYTQVEQAEQEASVARRINQYAPEVMAHAAKQCGALLVHYSTDYVFAGSGSIPHTEIAEIGPLNTYGETKLQGELAIRGMGCQYLILRTSWVYANRRRNFLRTILQLARERDSFSVVDDQWGTPTGADFLADCTAVAIRRCLQQPRKQGLYHLAPSGYTTWHHYAQFIVASALKQGAALRIRSPDRILPISSQDWGGPVVRPLNGRLNCSKFSHTFGLRSPNWRSGVAHNLSQLLALD